MKKILLCAFAVLLCVALTSCRKSFVKALFDDPPTKSIVLLFDDTDALTSKPTGSDVVSLFGFSNADIYNGYDLRIRRLSSVNLTSVYERKVPAQNSFSGSDMKRTALIKSYRKTLAEEVDSLAKEKTTVQQNSVLYRTIAQELNRMADDTTSATKICLIYSNMEEHSMDADFVSVGGFLQASLHRDQVAAKLEKVVPIKNLTGIEIRIVFKPASLGQEIKFDTDMEVFRSIFTAHHAKVTVSTDALNQ